MREAILGRSSAPPIATIVVWVDMLETDDRGAAERAARTLSGERLTQFHDARNFAGAAWMRDAFAGWREQALAVLPEGDPLRDALVELDFDPPLWDAYLFFPPGVRWEERAPRPTRWLRQVAWLEDGKSVLWKDYADVPPIVADLTSELRATVRAVVASGSNRASPEGNSGSTRPSIAHRTVVDKCTAIDDIPLHTTAHGTDTCRGGGRAKPLVGFRRPVLGGTALQASRWLR